MIDQIVRRLFITTPETVNANWESQSISLDSIERELSMSLTYENGSAVSMVVYMAFSNDNINFSRDLSTLTVISDSTGYILLDYLGVGSQFARFEVDVSAGSIDVVEGRMVGKRNH
jgi:hypothetical protein